MSDDIYFSIKLQENHFEIFGIKTFFRYNVIFSYYIHFSDVSKCRFLNLGTKTLINLACVSEYKQKYGIPTTVSIRKKIYSRYS